MANFLLLILFSAFSFSLSANAQFAYVRRSPIRAVKNVDGIPKGLAMKDWTSPKLIAQMLLTNMERHIHSALLIEKDLDATDKSTLTDILKILNSDAKNIRLFFAATSENLFLNASPQDQAFLTSYGYSKNRSLFDLPEYATHRFVVTGNSPGPILFNDFYFTNPVASPSASDLLGYLVHELGHQTGLGFSSEAFLDRLGQKVAKHVSALGADVSDIGLTDLKIYTDNFLSLSDLFLYPIKNLNRNTIGQLVLFSKNHMINLTGAIVSAAPDFSPFDSAYEYPIMVWVGPPYFAEVSRSQEFEFNQIIRGSATYVFSNKEGTKLGEYHAQYNVSVPLTKTASGTFEYQGQSVVISLDNVSTRGEVIVSSAADFKVEDVSRIDTPKHGIQAILQCSEKPKDFSLRIQILNSNPARRTDTPPDQFYHPDFVKLENGRCYYLLNAESELGFTPRLKAVALDAQVELNDGRMLILPLPKKFIYEATGDQTTHSASEMKISDIEMYWAKKQPDGSYSLVEEINTKLSIDPLKLKNPDLELLVMGKIDWGSVDYCTSTLVFSGQRRNYPGLTSAIYIGDFFPQDNKDLLPGSLFTRNSYSYLGKTGISFINIINKTWLNANMIQPKLAYVSARSCAFGSTYFDVP